MRWFISARLCMTPFSVGPSHANAGRGWLFHFDKFVYFKVFYLLRYTLCFCFNINTLDGFVLVCMKSVCFVFCYCLLIQETDQSNEPAANFHCKQKHVRGGGGG